METESLSDDAGEKLLLPPTPGTFQSREELITYVREYGASQGYVVTIKKSRRDRRVILGCDRGGVYRNRLKVDEKKRKRKATSRLINCPFEAIGKKDDDEWVLTVKNGEHNHEALRDMSEHPYSRRFTEEEVSQIKVMTEVGLKPRQVLKALKQKNPKLQSTPRHLYNVKAKIRQGNFTDKTFKSRRPNNSSDIFMALESSTKNYYPIPNLIGGKFVESKACAFIDVLDPATQELVSLVPLTTYEEFKAAIGAAKQAFPKWKNTPVTARQHIMFKLHELIRRDIDKLATTVATEQGKTLKSARGEVLRGLEVVEQACGMATLQMGDFVPNASNGIDTCCIREPLGVCAGICPFNFPATISLWMFPVAVTCGNTFILKPSEINPGASMIIAELAMEAGLPDGVLNIVHGTHDIVNHICDDVDVKAISLLSSDNDGMLTYARAAARGKRVQSTLGVKNHAIVMPDASIDATVDALVSAGFSAAGQRCMALSAVIFVGGSRTWEEELVRRAKELNVTAGKEPGADLGPVITKEAKDHTCSLVQNGVESGARLVLDGRNILVPRYERGNFVGPTILCDVTTSMDCYKEEMSGPVLLCMKVDKLEEAVTIVNRQKNGSGTSIFTTSGVAARKFQNEVDTEMVGVNVPVPVPFSPLEGSKASISGDLNFYGKGGVQYYTKIKIVAQHWRDEPVQILPLRVPQIPKTQSSQALPQLHPPTSESDTPIVEVSSATPSASERNIASQNALLSLPPLSEVGSSDMMSISSKSKTIFRELSSQRESLCMVTMSERDLINQEISLAMPTATEHDLNVQGASLSIHETSERINIPQILKAGQSPSLKLPRTEPDMTTPGQNYMPRASHRIGNKALTSLRMDISMDHITENSVSSSHRNDILSLMSARIDNMGPNYQGTEITDHPTFGGIYAPQGDLNMTSKGRSPIMHPGSEREYLPMSYRNDMVESQRKDTPFPTTKHMYGPSAVETNHDLPTISKGFGRGMFGTTAPYKGEYSGQGVSSTSQRL